MKKFLRYALLSAIAMFSTAAMADNTTTIGAEDNTTAWWTVFSDPFTIEPNKTLTLKFTNYSKKEAFYQNWSVILTQDVEWGTAGSEYLVLRADNYGWQYGLNTGNESSHDWYTSLSSNYNWDTFKDDMDGSTVVMTIKREYESVTVRADITPAAGGSYFEEMVLPCGEGTQNIRAYLTVDHAHIVLDNAATTVTDTELPDPLPEGTIIGNRLCTSAWWTAFSELNTIDKDKTLHMEFTNFTSGVNNFNNWVLVLTDGKYVTEEGYGATNEYLVLRADNYGWGAKYELGTRLHFRNTDIPGLDQLTSEDEKIALYWSTFREEMQGAYVIMDIKRQGTAIDILVGMVAKSGAIWYETFKSDNFVEADQTIGAFLTVDGSCLVIDDSKTAITDTEVSSGIQTVASLAAGTSVRYNLAGQQVGAAYKGVVIENGKKIIIK